MKRIEQGLQTTVAAWLSLQKNVVWFAVNNNPRSARDGARLKKMGCKKGIPDLAFILPDGRFAAIELKSPKGVLSQEQKQWRDLIKKQGGEWALARSLEDVAHFVKEWYR